MDSLNAEPRESAAGRSAAATGAPAAAVSEHAGDDASPRGERLALARAAADAGRSFGVRRVGEAAQTVLTALLLALMFRAFMVEPFIIPTGSMAETLLGSHGSRVCEHCGWEYVFGPASRVQDGAAFELPREVLCPNCLARSAPSPEGAMVKAGDRLLIEKWSHLTGAAPLRRWEVVVFRDRTDPQQHVIKRLAGLPGERVQIIDGDLYINGRLEPKPPHVARTLRQVVFDQSHAPRAGGRSAAARRWVPNGEGGGDAPAWRGLDSRVLRFSSSGPVEHLLRFAPVEHSDYTRDVYGYNRGSSGALVHDVGVSGQAEVTRLDGGFGIELTRPPVRATLRLEPSGVARAAVSTADGGRVLAEREGRLGPWRASAPIVFDVRVLDGAALIRASVAGGGEVSLTAATDSDDSEGGTSGRPQVALRAVDAELALRGVRIDRDVHYVRTSHTRRATADEAFELGPGEYFVLGDNSPDSYDSREWTTQPSCWLGAGSAGTVSFRQIVGRAAFVYLPGVLPGSGGSVVSVPDLGRTRFVR